jgi:hypothetical protein
MAKAKKQRKPQNVEKKARAPEFEVTFLKGRHARRGGIRREDSPYTGLLAETWLEGWDYENEAQGG